MKRLEILRIDDFDETPLYSRYAQIDFLDQFGDKNLLLIELALDFLDRVTMAMVGDRIGRFAAITVISDDDGVHFVPQIFVCNGDVMQRLAALKLSEASSELGKLVSQLVEEARPAGFVVLEDGNTVPGEVRVFIGQQSPPHGFIHIAQFAEHSCKETT